MLKLYVDKNGNLIKTNEQAETNKEQLQDMPLKKQAGIFGTIAFAQIGQFIQHKSFNPIFKQLDFYLGKKLVNKFDKVFNKQFIEQLGKIKNNYSYGESIFFLNNKNQYDTSITNIAQKSLGIKTPKATEYVSSIAGNYLAYNLVQTNSNGNDGENFGKFNLIQQPLMFFAVSPKNFARTIQKVGLDQTIHTISNKVLIHTKAQQKAVSTVSYNWATDIKSGTLRQIKTKKFSMPQFLSFGQFAKEIKLQYKSNVSNYTRLSKDYQYDQLQNIVSATDMMLAEKDTNIQQNIQSQIKSKADYLDKQKGYTIKDLLEHFNKHGDETNSTIIDATKTYEQLLSHKKAGTLTEEGKQVLDIFENKKIYDNFTIKNGQLKTTKMTTGQKLFWLNEFTRDFKIPFLGFNPLSLLQTRLLKSVYEQPIAVSFDKNQYFKDNYLGRFFVSQIFKNESKKDDFVKLIYEQLKGSYQEYNKNPFIDTPFEPLLKFSNKTQFLKNTHMNKDFYNFYQEISSNASKYFEADNIDEFKKLFNDNFDAIAKGIISDNNYVDITGTIANGKVFIKSSLNNTKYKDDIPKSMANFGKFIDDLNVTINDFHYYQVDKTLAGNTIIRTYQMQTSQLKHENRFFENVMSTQGKMSKKERSKLKQLLLEHDLPFNEQYNFDENKIEELKTIYKFLTKEKIIDKEYKQALQDLEEGKEINIQNVKTIFRLFNETQDFDINKVLFDKLNIKDFTELNAKELQQQFTDLMEYFKDLQSFIYKLDISDKKKDFFLSFLPNKFELDESKRIKELLLQNKINEQYINEAITTIGQTRKDIMVKYLTFNEIAKNTVNKNIWDLQEDTHKTYSQQFANYANIYKNIFSFYDYYQSGSISKTNLLTKWNSLFKIQKDEIKSIYQATKTRLKRPDLIEKILEKSEKEKLLKTQLNKSNWLIFTSASKSQNTKGIFLPNGERTTYASIYAHYIADRTTQLFEEIGLGRPNPNKTKNQQQILLQVGLKRALPIYATWQGMKQIDQLITRKTGDETPLYQPSKLLQETFTSFKLGVIKLLEVTQIARAVNAISARFPHAIPLQSQYYGLKRFGTGNMFLFGQLGTMLERIPDSDQYALEVTGNKNVPIRQARWWEFGRTPYYGGKTTYYRPHLSHVIGSRWQYTDVLYGSGWEYFRHKNAIGQIATFGQFDRNYFVKKHSFDRPYPVADQSTLYGVPFVGNTLQAQQSLIPGQKSQLVQGGQSYNINDREYYLTQSTPTNGSVIGKLYKGQQNLSLNNYTPYNQTGEYISRAFKQAEDYLGFVGFMGSNITSPIKAEADYKQEIARPELMYGNRLYYQKELGGMLGMTELYRRFVNNNYGKYGSKYFNPLPNLYFQSNFNWLPKDYFTDFYHGDVYASMPYGEIRLPGPGYEQTNKLYDNYGKIDQYLITQNVQPYSYDYMLNKRMMKKNGLNPNERYLVTRADAEVKDVKNKLPYVDDDAFTTKLKKETFEVKEVLNNGQLIVEGENVPVRIAGVEFDTDLIAKHLFETTNVGSIQEAYSQADQLKGQYIQQLQKHKTIAGYVQKDENKRYRMDENGEITLELISRDLAKTQSKLDMPNQNLSWQDKAQRYRTFTPGLNIPQNISDFFQHRFGFLYEKFSGVTSQLEEYERYMVFGKKSQNWSKPIQDFIIPQFFTNINQGVANQFIHSFATSMQAGTTMAGKQMQQMFLTPLNTIGALAAKVTPLMPSDTKKRYELEEKYQVLKAERGERSIFEQKNISSLFKYLPTREKPFFQHFVNQSQKELKRIQQIAPEYTKSQLEEQINYKEQVIAGNQYTINMEQHLKQAQQKIGKLEEYYYDVNQDIEFLYTREVYSKFNDTSKFQAYTNNLYKQQQSILKDPLENNYQQISLLNTLQLRDVRERTNGEQRGHINVQLQNGSYAF